MRLKNKVNLSKPITSGDGINTEMSSWTKLTQMYFQINKFVKFMILTKLRRITISLDVLS